MDAKEAVQAVQNATDLGQLEAVRLAYLGKKGFLTQELRKLGSLPPEERRTRGAEINQLRDELERLIAERSQLLEKQALAATLAAERIDVTLPGTALPVGGKHLTSRVGEEIEEIFIGLGFTVVTGPEIETEYYNFDALNVPKYHPARDMWDTLWFPDGRLLRTHTSPMQIRYMETHRPPFKIIVPGRVYRFEQTDATHEAMFFQVEGLVVGKQVSMADLRGTLNEMGRRLYGRNRQVGFVPSYYPFVEPGADFYVQCAVCQGRGCTGCKGQGRLEIGGCGMVHPNVFQAVGYKGVTGFAFGLGLERIAMQKYRVPDIRLFYANNLAFLEQFRGAGLPELEQPAPSVAQRQLERS